MKYTFTFIFCLICIFISSCGNDTNTITYNGDFGIVTQVKLDKPGEYLVTIEKDKAFRYVSVRGGSRYVPDYFHFRTSKLFSIGDTIIFTTK